MDMDIKKKRGRKKKMDISLEPNKNELQPNAEEGGDAEGEEEEKESTVVLKRRGRKPKGGKLILKQPEQNNPMSSIANIILHLKCSLNDLNDYNINMNKMVTNPMEYNPNIPPDVLTYNQDEQTQFTLYNDNEIQQGENPTILNNTPVDNNNNNICSICSLKNFQNDKETKLDDVSIKDINYKLKKLKINLYKNMSVNKNSACFWCTYEYDNPPCYIPKYEMDQKIYGYGSFCRPECAVAYLMKETIDDSTKFERYHLLNQIYSKIYDFKKNIKPAPNPYYLLDKYYGNLSIQEYRKLLKTEHMLLVIDKPLTRILPELHEDNDDMMSNIYGTGNRILNNSVNNTTGVYKVKRQTDKQQGPTKTSIIRDKFGMS
jgi:hypothetical protein